MSGEHCWVSDAYPVADSYSKTSVHCGKERRNTLDNSRIVIHPFLHTFLLIKHTTMIQLQWRWGMAIFLNGGEILISRKPRALHLLNEFHTCVVYYYYAQCHTSRVGCGCGDGLPLTGDSWSVRSISEIDCTRQSLLST